MDVESRSTPAQRGINEQPIFSYSSLSNPRDIRLIKVESGAWTDPIQCQVHHVSLDHQPQFVALSYTWGDATKCCSLYAQSGYLNITQSLHSALQHLRRYYGLNNFVVWADAVCINQEDSKEKAVQVQLMGDIYTTATATVVFLGEEKDNSQIALEILLGELKETGNMDRVEPALWVNELTRAVKKVLNQSRMSFLTPFHTEFAARLREKNISHEEWEKKVTSLAAFFRRPWYNRVWIQQEVLLQTSVYTLCGEWDGPLDWLWQATAAILGEGNIWAHAINIPDTHPGVTALIDLGVSRIRHILGLKIEFLHNVLDHSTSTRKASRARDHIFALTSLAEDGKDKAYMPDYEAPIEVIVKRVAHHIFSKTKDPHLFIARAGLGPDPNRFPSWIPNLLKGDDDRGVLNVNRHWEFCAAADTQTMVRLDAERSELAISSAYWDTVTKVGEVYRRAHISCFKDAEQFFSQIVVYPTGEDMGAVKLKTMVGNYIRDGETLEDIRIAYEAWSLVEMEQDTGIVCIDLNDPDTFPKTAVEAGYMFDSRCILHGTRLAVTQHGYVGVVPERCQVGDQIRIFSGAKVPSILRNVAAEVSDNGDGTMITEPGRTSRYRLIGNCYIHGIMEGEVMPLDFQEIVLF